MNLPDISPQLLGLAADQISVLGLRINFGNLTDSAPDTYSVLGWIVWLPVIGALINGIWGKKLGRQGVYIAGIGAVGASFLLSILAFFTLLKSGHAPAEAAAGAEGAAGEAANAAHHMLSYVARAPSIQQVIDGVKISWAPWDWFLAPTGPHTGEMIRMRYVVDPLSGVMLLVVTGVGTLIHVYSAGYMSHDEGYARFFAYLNLFIFAMLNLILGDSLVLLFLGWEGVGLASYLLIGFWYHNANYAFAGRKAFIVNRIGDAGLLMGMSIIAWKGGTYHFETLRSQVAEGGAAWTALTEHTGLGNFLVDALPFASSIPSVAAKLEAVNPTWGGLACLLLFVGACGKSAQFPLYVWLPDAMAGPTPVSALIHAATMVTAGIYLLCRLSFLYIHFTTVMNVIAIVGAFTALFAATIAVTQVELKKVLAYSTVSQLGFMFIGCGVGAFSAGFFHVFTHAFFKACLFLGAGAVMHACGDRQDIRELGGLKKYLPGTYWTFLVATLAIIGTPFFFSGFYSKDEILFRAFAHTWAPGLGKVIYAMGVLSATLTSFYMSRVFILTFLGDEDPKYLVKARQGAAVDELGAHGHGHDDHGDAHGHDDHGHGHHDPNPVPSEDGIDMKLMVAPLWVLAAMAILASVLGLPHWMTHREGTIAAFLEHPVADGFQVLAPATLERLHGLEIPAMVGGIAAWAIGAGLAYWVYIAQKGAPADAAAQALPGLYKLVVDKWRIDELYDLIIVRPLRGFASLVAIVDRFIIDGAVNLVGLIAIGLGKALKPLQTGAVQVYGAFIGIGALAVVVWAVGMPAVAISQKVENGQAHLEASGGPGYTYRWATFEANREAADDTLAARCPLNSVAAAALSTAGEPSAEARHDEALQTATGRCVVVEARNAFGRRAYARALIISNAPGTVVVPGNN
ncbi:MAG: NADH-quinone oxidoreductase subunit L [Polyangiales bacterium]